MNFTLLKALVGCSSRQLFRRRERHSQPSWKIFYGGVRSLSTIPQRSGAHHVPVLGGRDFTLAAILGSFKEIVGCGPDCVYAVTCVVAEQRTCNKILPNSLLTSATTHGSVGFASGDPRSWDDQ
jgi:hypothetical protein